MEMTLKRRLFGVKRPKGPSYFELLSAFKQSEQYAVLDFPVKLTEKYGDLIYFRRNQYMVTGPEGFQHILKTNAKNYTKQNIVYDRLKKAFGTSLLTTDGNEWKNRRKISQPAFHSHVIQHYVPSILEHTEKLIQKLQVNFKDNSEVNMLTLMNRLTLEIALDIFSNEIFSEKELNKLGKAIYFMNWYVSRPIPITPFDPSINNLKFYLNIQYLNKILLNIIEKRRNNREQEPKTDVLALLLEGKNEQGQYLNNIEILNEFKTLLMTGHETTACALTWMFYLLAKHPDWQEKMQNELEEVLNGRAPTIQDLPKLSILNAIFNETLRLYPPIWNVIRVNSHHVELYGFEIPKHSSLILNIYALHRNPHYWSYPYHFDPSRFLGDTEHLRSIFLPFISGPRSCIASNLAQMEGLLIAAYLAQNFYFEKSKKTRVLLEPCVSLRPKNGLNLKIKKR